MDNGEGEAPGGGKAEAPQGLLLLLVSEVGKKNNVEPQLLMLLGLCSSLLSLRGGMGGRR